MRFIGDHAARWARRFIATWQLTGLEAAKNAAAFAMAINAADLQQQVLQQRLAAVQTGKPEHFTDEVEINDFPQQARWKVTRKENVVSVQEYTGAAVTTRGVFVQPGKNPPPGERKLFLLIEGPTADSVAKAKKEIKRLLDEATANVPESQRISAGGRHSVL